MNSITHKLTVSLDGGERVAEFEHHESCIRAEFYRGDEHLYTEWHCPVADEVASNGWPEGELPEPGSYWAIAFIEKHTGIDWTEYTTGLTLLEAWEVEEGDESTITTDGVTVWVTNLRGFTIGRFGRLGIDVHNADSTACLHCTHEPTDQEDWDIFVLAMLKHHGVKIAPKYRPGRLDV